MKFHAQNPSKLDGKLKTRSTEKLEVRGQKVDFDRNKKQPKTAKI